MASPAAVLNILLTANTTQANAALAKTQGQLVSTGKTATAASVTMKKAMLGAGVAAGAAAAALFKVGKEFDDAFDTISTRTGATGRDMRKLKDVFRDVVSDVPASFEDAATAVGDLNTRLGLSGKPLKQMSKQMTELSRITKTDVSGNVEAVSKAFVDWEVKTKKQAKTLDAFFRLSQKSGLAVADIASNVQKFGSPLRQLGIDLDTAAAMFANFERAGVNTATMVPGLKLALANLNAPIGEAEKQLKAFNITIGNAPKGLQEVFAVLGDDKVKAVDRISLAMATFGHRAGADMKEAIEQGRFEVEKYLDVMKGGESTILDQGRRTRDLAEEWTLFVNRLKVLVEPVATAVFKTVGDAMKALNKIDFKAAIQSIKDFWENATVLRTVVTHALDLITTAWKNFAGFIKPAVKAVSSLLTGDFGAAWDAVKDLFRQATRTILAIMKNLTAPFRAAAEAIGNGLADGFSAAWDKITGVFQSGANALKDIVNWIISNVINRIPGVELGLIGGSAGGGASEPGNQGGPGPHRKATQMAYRGAKITAPTAIVGEQAPAHPEFVLATNPAYRTRNLHLWQQAGGELGVPGFQMGGVTGTVGSAFASNLKSASSYINKMSGAPFGSLPGFMAGTGDYVKDKFATYIKDKVSSLAESAADAISGTTSIAAQGPEGIGSFMGVPMANWVVQSLTYAARKGVSPQPTSGYRSHAYNVSQGRNYFSEHEGTQYPHGAVDYGGYVDPVALANKLAVVAATANYKYPLLAPIGFRDDGHASGTGHFMGGILGKAAGHALQMLAGGGVIGRALPKALQPYNHMYSPHWAPDWGGETMPVDKIAMLAEFFGMPGVTMAQIAHGESGYRPGSAGVDASPTPGVGVTKGYGLWAITSPFAPSAINRLGGYEGMWNPIANAIIASKMYQASGLQPWHGTRYLTDTNAHWTGSFGDLVSAAHPDRGGNGNGSSNGHHGGNNGGNENQGTGTVGPGGGRGSGMSASLTKLLDTIRTLRKKTPILQESFENAQTIDAMLSSPGGSELTDAERAAEVGLGTNWLTTLAMRAKLIGKAIRILPKGHLSKRLGQELVGLQGLTGQGGEILTVKGYLDALGAANIISADTSELDTLKLAEAQEWAKRFRVSQAQYGVFAGMKAGGGSIPAGQWGIAGDAGPEVVRGPAQVHSNAESQSMLTPVGGKVARAAGWDSVYGDQIPPAGYYSGLQEKAAYRAINLAEARKMGKAMDVWNSRVGRSQRWHYAATMQGVLPPGWALDESTQKLVHVGMAKFAKGGISGTGVHGQHWSLQGTHGTSTQSVGEPSVGVQPSAYLTKEPFKTIARLVKQATKLKTDIGHAEIMDAFSWSPSGAELSEGELAGQRGMWQSLIDNLKARASLLPTAIRKSKAVPKVQKQMQAMQAQYGVFAGMKAAGGYIPAGQWGIAGDAGPEVVRGPAQVHSNAESQSMLAPVVNVNVNGGAATQWLKQFISVEVEKNTRQRRGPLPSARGV